MLKNYKMGGSNGLVGELLKYGGSGMVCLLEQLFSVVRHEKTHPRQWKEGLIVSLFKKSDGENPGNYKGITLLSAVGKVFWVKYLIIDWIKGKLYSFRVNRNYMVHGLDKEGALHKGQASFRVNRK